MIEVVGKDGMIYHVDVHCPGSDIDHKTKHLSDVEERFLKVLKEGAQREPRKVWLG